jgi:hypothetical protein
MNERIQKLAVQAHVYADGHSLLCHEGDIKKFAELIVRDVLDEVLQAMDDGMDVYYTVADKFGVKE